MKTEMARRYWLMITMKEKSEYTTNDSIFQADNFNQLPDFFGFHECVLCLRTDLLAVLLR